MALTKVSSSLTNFGSINVFDYLNQSEIDDIKSRTASIDVAAKVQSVIDANPNREIYFPGGRYRLEAPIQLGKQTGTNTYTSVVGEDASGTYFGGTVFNFINCTGIIVNDLYQQIKNLWIYGQQTGASLDLINYVYGNVGIRLSGASPRHGGGSKIENVQIWGFDTGLSADNENSGFGGAYFAIDNLNIYYCQVGMSCVGTTDFRCSNVNVRICTKHGLFFAPGGYGNGVFTNFLGETLGTLYPYTKGNAGVYVGGASQVHFVGGYFEQASFYAEEGATITYDQATMQKFLPYWGMGHFYPNGSGGGPWQVIDTGTLTASSFLTSGAGITLTDTNTADNPDSIRVQSSTDTTGATPAEYVQYRHAFTDANPFYNKTSMKAPASGAIAKFALKVEFQIKFVYPLPTSINHTGFVYSCRVVGINGADGLTYNLIGDINDYDFSDGEWHNVTLYMHLRSGPSYIIDYPSVIESTFSFDDVDFSSTALDLYFSGPRITFYQIM